MIDYYMLDGVLDKVKMIIGIEKLDDAKILIITDNKFAYEVALKNIVILILCVSKDGDKFYLQRFSEESL